MNKYKTLAFNTALISIGTFASKLLMFLMVRFYTSCLTPADYSTADLIMQTSNLLSPLISLGIAEAVFRFAVDGSEDRSGVFSTGVFSVSAGLLLYALLSPVFRFIPILGDYVVLIGIFTAASCYHLLCAQFVRAIGNTRLFAVQGLLNTALMVSFNILFLAVLKQGVYGYIKSVIIADALSTCYMTFKEKLWNQLTKTPKIKTALVMLNYSIPLIPTGVFWWITGVSDRYMVAGFIGSDANGLYSVAYKIPTVLTILASIFMQAWHFSAVYEANTEHKENIKFYSKVWRAFQGAMFLCGSGIIAFSQIAIRILSAPEYYDAWKYIPMLSMAMVFSSFSNFLGSVYVVKMKSTLSFRTAMIGAIINIVLNLLLIPSSLGVHGAAIATLASCFFVFILRISSARRLIPFSINPNKLIISTVLLVLQTLFIVLELPLWQFVQFIGISLILLMNHRTFIKGFQKIGLIRIPKRKNA